MASPAAHSIIGLAMGAAWFLPRAENLKELARHAWNLRTPLFICVFLANAPDIDYLFGIPYGNLNLFHHTATHTAIWIIILSAALWAIGWPERTWRAFIFLVLLTGSHLIIDSLTEDNSKPYGMMLGWPFCLRYFISPASLFSASSKTTLMDLPSLHNLRVIIIETLITSPLLVITIYFKTRERRFTEKN